jgi:hypothetical protein
LTKRYACYDLIHRFRMLGGEPPVLRMLWARENDAWRITAFDVETP